MLYFLKLEIPYSTSINIFSSNKIFHFIIIYFYFHHFFHWKICQIKKYIYICNVFQ